MHYADIIAALHKANHKPVEVANHFGIARATVSMIIHGTTSSKRVAKHISEVIGVPVKELWPDVSAYKDMAA